ncbi:MAG: GNAT family N-acetyltransferase [Bacteroidetes bacterium]|nr:MAG: GNAT family N-acetyltransferase [Bacteroidota bacterium]
MDFLRHKDFLIRKAESKDLNSIVKLLADDPLGEKRENYQQPLPESYVQAFERISSDTNQELMVLEHVSGTVIGTLQLTFIPYLTHQGSIRAQIEAVRIKKEFRGQGLGDFLFRWAIQRAQDQGARMLQLTTDKQRPEAIEFYERLGFKASHEGMKLALLPKNDV